MIYELSLKPLRDDPGNLELLGELVVGLGVAPEEIIEKSVKGRKFICVYSKTKLLHNRLLKGIHSCKLMDVSVRGLCLEKSDWQDKWKENFKPFRLTKRFTVVPLWEKNNFKGKGGDPVYIDTSLAFGTGLHETTRFMVQLVERCSGKFRSFLDLGTGTGILSIIGSKCGANKLRLVDISSDSIVMAKKNLKENGIRKASFKIADVIKLNEPVAYDFVAANLITHDLIVLKEKIVSLVKEGQYLAISGISLENEKKIRQAFSPFPLRCLKIQRGEKWLAMLFKKG